MTVGEALLFGAERLQPSLSNARREASWLLAAALGVREVDLRLDPDRELPDETTRLYREWINRRLHGEPAHHLVGSCDFWGRRFLVTRDVLVPRPETEFLIKFVLDLPLPEQSRVVDIGAGSGCIALTLKAERPLWNITAVDISLAAIGIIRCNRQALHLDLPLVNSDLGASLGPGWHLITANLPYIPTASLKHLPPEVQYDPVLALDGGTDGLDLVDRMIADLNRLLVPGGFCVLEIGENQADEVSRRARHVGLVDVSRIRDLAGTERIITLQKPAPTSCQQSRFEYS